MSARHVHLENMIPELDEMRNSVAEAARVESDAVSHRAYLMQARSLRALYGQIASTWFNAEQEVRNDLGEVEDDVVERRYVTRLSGWLRDHVRKTADLTEGGEADTASRASGIDDSNLKINRLFADRHHKMIADYCERSAADLDDREAELRGAALRRP